MHTRTCFTPGALIAALGLVLVLSAPVASAAPASSGGAPDPAADMARISVTADPAIVATSVPMPGKPVLALKHSQLVNRRGTLRGTSASDATTMTLQSRTRGHGWVDRWSGGVTVASDGSFELPLAGLPYGALALRVVAINPSGVTISAGVHVHNLGVVPAYRRMVLVDRSSRWLYVIVGGRVTGVHRCAVGMPWTPTPLGTFRLGHRHRTPNWYWGPWRLQLSRKTTSAGKTRYVATKYYIHGTSVPSSIGHYASHGCVRLYNKTIRDLSTRVDGYMAVIRE